MQTGENFIIFGSSYK